MAFLSIGLMSGTSMDGIDASLLKTDGSGEITELEFTSVSYNPAFKILLKAAEYAIRKQKGNLEQAKSYYTEAVADYLNYELKISKTQLRNKLLELSAYLPMNLDQVIRHSTQLHSLVVKKLLEKTHYNAEQIDVIGYHGQTLFHCPAEKVSIIVGDGQYLADELGITVVTDFRSRDIAAGGQGAPFAPLYHQALALRDNRIPIAVVNCGGIANLTLITNENPLDLIAYDSGPGNGLIDRLVQQRTQGKEQMDVDGRYGLRGKVNLEILKLLYEKSSIRNGRNYFHCAPPKSLDIADLSLIDELEALSLEDACATLEAFTADTIVNSLELSSMPEIPSNWILSGGGWNNPVIQSELTQRLHGKFGKRIKIFKAQEIGWNSQALEAQIFAYFAVRSLQNKPLSVPGTTGVSMPMSGGRVFVPVKGASERVRELL